MRLFWFSLLLLSSMSMDAMAASHLESGDGEGKKERVRQKRVRAVIPLTSEEIDRRGTRSLIQSHSTASKVDERKSSVQDGKSKKTLIFPKLPNIITNIFTHGSNQDEVKRPQKPQSESTHCESDQKLAKSVLNLDTLDSVERAQRLNAIETPQEITDANFQILKDTLDVLSDHQIPHMAAYGTILDIARHTVPHDGERRAGIKRHDDDIDLAIDLIYKADVQELSDVFSELGYDVKYDARLSRLIIESQKMLTFSKSDSRNIRYRPFVDIFVFKNTGEKFELAEDHARDVAPLKNGWFTKNEFSQRRTYRFGPLYISAPSAVGDYLNRKYGPHCLTQGYFIGNHMNPVVEQYYSWTLTEEERQPAFPSKLLQDRYSAWIQKKAHQEYWDGFYAEHTPSKTRSSFAHFVNYHKETKPKKGMTLLNFACGDSPDSFYFAEKGMKVIGLDYSKTVIEKNSKKAKTIGKNAPSFQYLDVTDSEQLTTLHELHPNYIYGRFFLHSLTESQCQPFMDFLQAQKPSAKVFFEFRTDKDPLLQRSTKKAGYGENEGDADGHYRRFINMASFVSQMETFGYRISYAHEQNGISVVQKDTYTDDPYLARIIAVKELID